MAVSQEDGRSTRRRTALVGFLALMAMAQPPLVNTLANRIEPWVLGMPFLYAYLLADYLALVALLLWAWRADL